MINHNKIIPRTGCYFCYRMQAKCSLRKWLMICLLMIWMLPVLNLHAQTRILKDTTDSSSITKKIFNIRQVEINARKADEHIKAGARGVALDMDEIKLLPRLAGETDPLKALQFMGGVSQSGEASSGLYVRGGNNDQNLILFNGSPIQNPTHVLGIFSVFNPDIIGRMRFIKSGIPAEYGGRLSSVVDINTSNIIPEKITLDATIGLISSRLSLHIPLSKNLAIYGAARGSYLSSIVLPMLTRFGIDTVLTENKYEFYDLNAGFLWQINPGNRLSGHVYSGRDNIAIRQFKAFNVGDNQSGWGNKTANLQLQTGFTDKISLNQLLSYSAFDVQTAFSWFNAQQKINSGFSQWQYKADVAQLLKGHNLRYGLELYAHQASPHFVSTDSILPVIPGEVSPGIHAGQAVVFFRDEWETGKWLFNAGIRINTYQHFGPYKDKKIDENNQEKVFVHESGKWLKNYTVVEPRFFTRYLLNDFSSLKISTSRHVQYLNQIPVTNFGIPADLQIPAGLYVKPQLSWHYSGGYFLNTKGNAWEMSAEAYYKTLENQLEFNSSLSGIFTNSIPEHGLLTGKGWTYGLEYRIKRNTGKLTGWFNYQLAWSYRQFDGINAGKPFLAHNDRRHDISLAAFYQLTNRLELSGVFVFATGNRLNLPLSWYIINKQVILEYGRYNAFEMPPYHRLDLSLTYQLKAIGKLKSELNFSVYNVYNRANPFNIYFEKGNDQGSQKIRLYMAYLLPVIPSVSWKIHW